MTTDIRTMTVNGRTLAYRDVPGSGVPIVLVHGIGSSGATWGDIPERLGARGWRCIAIDLPGFGDSSKGPGDYSLGAMACAVRDLLDGLGIGAVHLVGHSLGGGVSMQFSYQFPDRVASLVLESSGGLGEETFSGLRAATLPGSDLALKVAINDRTLGVASWIGARLASVGVTPHALSPSALETVRWLGEDDRRAAFLATLRSVVGPRGQSVSALDKLHLMADRPVLIIWGDRDPMIPIAHGAAAHERLPHSRFVVFEGAGHEPHVDYPRRFTGLVSEHARTAAVDGTDACA